MYIHTYVHIHIHTYIHTCIHAYIRIYVYTYIHAQYACMHVCHACMSCMHAMRTYIRTYIHTYLRYVAYNVPFIWSFFSSIPSWRNILYCDDVICIFKLAKLVNWLRPSNLYSIIISNSEYLYTHACIHANTQSRNFSRRAKETLWLGVSDQLQQLHLTVS